MKHPVYTLVSIQAFFPAISSNSQWFYISIEKFNQVEFNLSKFWYLYFIILMEMYFFWEDLLNNCEKVLRIGEYLSTNGLSIDGNGSVLTTMDVLY